MATYFTPGPSHPYPKLRAFLDDAWAHDVASISHRGQPFKDIYRRTDAAVRELMDVPADWGLMFLGSATEAMERTVQGLAAERSHHLVNGAFSSKWHEVARQLGKQPSEARVAQGSGFDAAELVVPTDAELVCVTQNETSTGAAWPEGALAGLAMTGERPLVAIDVVSSAPIVPVPWNDVDAAFFSVQKAFGLPAGLGVLMAGPRALAKAAALQESGVSVGSYHGLPALAEAAGRFQTPATPNVLGIYLLGRVAEDMLARGAKEVRAENQDRAKRLYEVVDASQRLQPFVKDPAWRSPTVVVAEVEGGTSALKEHFAGSGVVLGSGYGKHSDQHVRIANFPTTSAAEFDTMLAHLVQFDSSRV